jgi:hypothetical protein
MSLPGYKFNPFSGELFPITSAQEAGAAPLSCGVRRLFSNAPYTLQLEDAGGLVVTAGGPVYVPSASVKFPIGTQILILSPDPGEVALEAGSSTVITYTRNSASQALIKIGDDEWIAA